MNLFDQKVVQFILKQEEKGYYKSKRALLRAVKFIYLWYSEVVKDRCMQRAASLTYTTLLAIFPFMAVMGLFVTVFLSGEMQHMQQAVLNFAEERLIPDAGDTFNQTIRGYFEAFRDNSKVVGLLGMVGLMFSVLLMFSSIEKAFNDIWQTRSYRSFISIFTRFTAIMVCVPILIGVSVAANVWLQRHAEVIGGFSRFIIPFMFTCLALTMSFFILPNIRVKFIYALIGGIFTSLLWEFAKAGFRIYVSSPKIAIIQKSLGAIPIFLMWTYFTWLIVLIGCELGFLLQNYKRLMREVFRKRPYTTLDSRLILLVYLVIAEHFQKGEGGITYAEILEKVSIKISEMDSIIDLLRKRQVITETTKGTFLPDKPLEGVETSDILSLGCNAGEIYSRSSDSYPEIQKVMSSLQECLENWADHENIKTLLEKKS